jgi:hypothetical protein
MATTPDPSPSNRDRAEAARQADPTGQNPSNSCISGMTVHSRQPAVMVPVVSDHDADDAAGWAGTVRPVSGPPGESGRGF